MEKITRNANVDREPEFLICHNKDDVEEAFDPFDDNQGLVSVKVEPSYDDFEQSEIMIVDVKPDKMEEESDHHNFENDNFDYDDESLITPLKIEVFDCTVEQLEPKCKSKNIAELNSPSSISETKNKPNKNAKKKTRVKETNSPGGAKKNSKKKSTRKSKVQPKEEHKCESCDKCFTHASNLKRHARIHVTPEKCHKCPLCEKIFSRSDHCEQHINNVHKGEVVNGVVRKPTYEQTCEICGKVFHHSSSYRKHQTLHTGERPFCCDECGKTFVWKQHLKSHLKLVHTDEKSFQCSICDKLFNHSGNYKKHMKVHSGERPFKCFCGKAFAQSSNYQVHMRMHTNDKQYKCDQCDKSFIQAMHLMKHKQVHQKDDNVELPFKCTECNKSFIYNYQLVTHLQSHTDERPYQCDKCGAPFKSTAGLKRHMKQHEKSPKQEVKDKKYGEMINTCTECNKTLANKRLLANHMKIHSGIKPFKCDYCEKCFITQSDCKKHMRIHTGEKPYQCSICQKQFTFSNSYQIHMRNHSGVKPFQCSYCDRAFSCSSDRSKHVKTHTNGRLKISKNDE